MTDYKKIMKTEVSVTLQYDQWQQMRYALEQAMELLSTKLESTDHNTRTHAEATLPRIEDLYSKLPTYIGYATDGSSGWSNMDCAEIKK